MIFTIFSYIVFPFAMIFLLFSGRRDELGARVGFGLKKRKCDILFHCSSVGEFVAVRELIKAFENRGLKVVVSTFTKTALYRAKEEFSTVLLPLDLSFLMRRFIVKNAPKLIVITETELWPNLIKCAHNKSIPIVVVNGRITKKSFSAYRRFSFFLKPVFSRVQEVGAQSSWDKQRYKNLGFKKVSDLGNLKFSANYRQYDSNKIRQKLGFKSRDFIVVFGCMRQGEDELMAEIYPTLKREIEHLKLIIVPRHLNWLKKLQKRFPASELISSKNKSSILIVDRMGELTKMYGTADICIVGGSFVEKGGHNPIEAASQGKAVIIGEFHSSCLDIVSSFKEEDAIVISNKKSLLSDLVFLYKNKKKRAELCNKTKKVISENRGSLQRYQKMIEKYL